jgi:release factor glutamine methyltransferase
VTTLVEGRRDVADAVEETARALAAGGAPNARGEAREIVARAGRFLRAAVDLRGREPWTAAAEAARGALVARRLAGWPLAYLLGEWDFRDTTLTVTPDVLIPRPETEELFDRVERAFGAMAPRRAADIGTGAGGLAIALARRWPTTRVTAVDIAPAALAVARWNARRWGVENRVEFIQGDLAAGLPPASFDAIVANLPYVAEGDWVSLSPEVRREPPAALLAGADGLGALSAVRAGGGDRAGFRAGACFSRRGRGQADGRGGAVDGGGVSGCVDGQRFRRGGPVRGRRAMIRLDGFVIKGGTSVEGHRAGVGFQERGVAVPLRRAVDRRGSRAWTTCPICRTSGPRSNCWKNWARPLIGRGTASRSAGAARCAPKRPTIWSGACARAWSSWARCWPGWAAPTSPCPAAAPSAPGPSTSTSKRSRPWAPKSR